MTAKEPISEREFELINIIGPELSTNQRELSKQMNLSLGNINMLIRRLVNKGIIRIEQLDSRKVKYLLTPKGISEKVQKSIKYTWKTLNSISLIKNNFKEVMKKLYQQGHRHFYVLGESDYAILVEIVAKELRLDDHRIEFIEELPQEDVEGMILICKEEFEDNDFNEKNRVDLIHELVTNGELVQT